MQEFYGSCGDSRSGLSSEHRSEISRDFDSRVAVYGSRAYTPTGNGFVCVVAVADPPAKRPCSNDINPVDQYPSTNNNKNGTVM